MDRTQNYNRESKGARGQAQVNAERQKTRTSGEDRLGHNESQQTPEAG